MQTSDSVNLLSRFRTFEHSVKDIENLVSHWERSTGMQRPSTPSDGAGQDNVDDIHQHPPSGRKTKKGGKPDQLFFGFIIIVFQNVIP